MYRFLIPLFNNLRSKFPSFALTFSGAMFIFTVSAQEKIEREYRIKNNQVPVRSIEYLEEVFPDNKARWYGEISSGGYFIEAKLKVDRKKYSIKFDSTGVLKDVEKFVKFRNLNEDQRIIIDQKLDSLFSRYKISKIQIQWIGSEENIKSFLQTGNASKDIRKNFEIILRGKNSEGVSYLEILFNDLGEIKRIHRISERNINHLIF